MQFFIVLLIILLAELILLILFFVYTDEVSNNAKQDLKEGLVLYNTDNNAGLKDAWNAIQGEVCVSVSRRDSDAALTLVLTCDSFSWFRPQWRCCGVMGHNDWYSAMYENVVPDRCCQQFYQGCGRNASNALWTRVSQAVVCVDS